MHKIMFLSKPVNIRIGEYIQNISMPVSDFNGITLFTMGANDEENRIVPKSFQRWGGGGR